MESSRLIPPQHPGDNSEYMQGRGEERLAPLFTGRGEERLTPLLTGRGEERSGRHLYSQAGERHIYSWHPPPSHTYTQYALP